MSFATRHNKWTRWDIDTTGFAYHNLDELDPAEVYQIYGFYINTKSNFGPYPVAIMRDGFLNLPGHLLEDVKAMLESDADVEAIKAGHAGLQVEKYTSKKYNRECLSVTWCDL